MRTAMTLVGPYCHPPHVQSSPCSSQLLTMLTTQEGGAPRTLANQGRKAEDDGEASDGMNRSRGRCAGPVVGGGEYEG